jgi:hydrogenase maturation protease
MNSPRILVAGIGNIFLGDDAFGVETVVALLARPLPDGIVAKDFGTRGHDLAFAMGEGYDAVVFVDATPRGKAPGTLCLMELEMPGPETESAAALGGHSLEPVAVLQLAASLGTQVGRLFLVGCEPGVLEDEDGAMELSAPVRAAVAGAVAMIEELLGLITQGAPLPEPEAAVAENN